MIREVCIKSPSHTEPKRKNRSSVDGLQPPLPLEVAVLEVPERRVYDPREDGADVSGKKNEGREFGQRNEKRSRETPGG